ncbi:SpoIIE family protein phosphatase [Streptomyces sp. T-3]|nr:SpoIIE family protein phosphatase [Streptomyces sp. T-3]
MAPEPDNAINIVGFKGGYLAILPFLALTIAALAALDLAYRDVHSGFVVGLTALPAFGLLVTGPRRRRLMPGVLSLATTVVLSIGTWADRPFTTFFSLLTIAMHTFLVWRFAPSTPRTAVDLDVEDPVPTERRLQNNGSWQLNDLRAEFRCLPLPSVGTMAADFQEAKATPYGIRVLVADLPGKSDATLAVAKELLYRWRRHCLEEPSLSELALRLDSALSRHLDTFAKVLLMNVTHDGSRVEFICCGHQPPYVLSDDSVTMVEPLTLLPPLGLFSLSPSATRIYVTSVSLTAGRRLLVLTDGATETVDDQGLPFPLSEHALALEGREPGAFLSQLAEKLCEHRGDSPRDEAMLLLLEQSAQIGTSGGVAATVHGSTAA